MVDETTEIKGVTFQTEDIIGLMEQFDGELNRTAIHHGDAVFAGDPFDDPDGYFVNLSSGGVTELCSFDTETEDIDVTERRWYALADREDGNVAYFAVDDTVVETRSGEYPYGLAAFTNTKRDDSDSWHARRKGPDEYAYGWFFQPDFIEIVEGDETVDFSEQ